ncbi:hypothetical protein PUNSTDRAFT_137644 [Punctularia strigosozonata HHB-11173 SS5]|uniref:uncharacterized protein n=1 Tax=Punctularia strigosozonata (strain HHB-11173) TaxID=741275 RepID=UPI0004416B47|nr:uncharacterized protein PUNSTDRAFT_137644 [Punctularia strigosozonata HHB-11173 SS5]EIN05537.1 hypothetical protein PUNSTDRAFT_137644 [Punctularia strigosozonata HHB-11173 SS5]
MAASEAPEAPGSPQTTGQAVHVELAGNASWPQCRLRQCILEILNTYSFSTCSPVKTPMNPNLCLSTSMAPSTPDDVAYMQDKPYVGTVDALLYLAICTHLDISYSWLCVLSHPRICFLSAWVHMRWKERFQHCP